MRAAVLQKLGHPPTVAEFGDPEDAAEARAGEAVVLEVLAAGLNPIDLRVASGALADRSPAVPSVVGSEGVGRTQDGRRVYFRRTVAPFGSIAERTLVPPDALIDVPDGIDDAVAVACGIAGSAGWGALTRVAKLQRGEKVLVLGASGVVGSIAVQVAKLLGAGSVTAAARSAEGLERAKERGANKTVQIADELTVEGLTKAFLDAGGPYDLVIDPLWGAPASAALEALATRGRLVQLGQSADSEATFSPVKLRFSELSILGYTNFLSTPEEERAALDALWGYAVKKKLTIDIESVALDDAADAWKRQAGSPRRKLVIVPN
ncbi:quinone oxidoreductase family protein [Baekduia sp. Peel2402]|uniref:quinone oxidoreductase family protein n=1 Tax=Baekduia sp. Peel2402 TaxID=3458296 RepID=UPI00403E50DE